MKRMLLLLVLLFFSVSCTPSAEEIISDLVSGLDELYYEEEGYNCYPGYAVLPGSQIPEGVTPQGYHWRCTGGDIERFHADGRITGTMGSSAEEIFSDYWQDCRLGTRPPAYKGRWSIIVETETLCIWYDMFPGLYFCAEDVDYQLDSSGQVIVHYSINGYIDAYDSSGNLLDRLDSGNETCTLTEE